MLKNHANPKSIRTYIKFPIELWKRELQQYHDKDFIIDGLTNKFLIGIDSGKTKTGSLSTRRTHIPIDGPTAVAICELMQKGVKKGFISGPYTDKAHLPKIVSDLHISPIFGIKQPNKIRPIHHLSFPKNKRNDQDMSVNDMLRDELKTAQYTSFREVIELILKAGRNSYLFILDAQDAYYRVPIHENDYHLNY